MRDHIFLALLIVCLFSSSVFAVGGDLGGASQDGSEDRPYLIEDFNDFQIFCDDPNYWVSGVYTRLDCDLDLDPNLAGRVVYSQAPIAGDTEDDSYFRDTIYEGHFDGNDHVISNLTIDGVYYCGLFGKTENCATIADLGIEQADVTSPKRYVAGLVGYNSGSINKCYATGAVTGDEHVGGLVGINHGSISECYTTSTVTGDLFVAALAGGNSGSITSCYSIGEVTGDDCVGGLVGSNNGSITSSYSTGMVTSDDRVGGLVGSNNGSITSSYSTGVVVSDDHVGGLAGDNSGSISQCYCTGTVTGDDHIGGLVGNTYSNSSISECYATGAVTGDDRVGGLVGCHHSGSINKCYATGAVIRSGSDSDEIGGLIGYNAEGIISQCYATGAVTGLDSDSDYVGGLVGKNEYGNISQCYAIGVVIGSNSDSDYVAGLVGYNKEGSIIASYFYIYGGPDNGYGKALDDEQLLNKDSFIGFDFAGDSADGSEDIWTIETGYIPRLTWQVSPGFEAPYGLDHITTSLSGSGYPDDPFIISDLNDLMEFRNNSALRIGFYSLITDIDLAGVTYTEAFIVEVFNGSFAGNGHVIKNLTIYGENYLGFFSKLYGSVDCLGLKNIFVSGSGPYVGSLIGCNEYGSISGCYATGVVNGSYSDSDYVGGLVGCNEYGNITECYATSVVTGDYYIGGLVGSNSGSISNSYSITEVNSFHTVGGLVGFNSGSISKCYANGLVTGHFVGGGLVGQNDFGSISECYATSVIGRFLYPGCLVGMNYSGSISSCFWDVEISGFNLAYTNCVGIYPDNIYTAVYSTIGIAEGKTTLEMQTKSMFTDASWDFVYSDGDAADWMMLRETEDYPRLAWQEIYPGDIAGLYGVNFIDFMVFAAAWQTSLGDVNYNDKCDFVNDDMIDFDDLRIVIDNWLRVTPLDSDDVVWVDVNDVGVLGHEGFRGQVSKYETTNGQYCQFLNAALSSGDIYVSGSYVYGDSGSNIGEDFVDERYYNLAGGGFSYDGAINGGAARISYVDGVFEVESGFENHPVTYVSWYGAKAFCNYYGYRLPTEWEWQAVADYDGSYGYGCGLEIDTVMANIYNSDHPDGAVEVGSFGDSAGYGYGVCDMAGNVWEWTDSSDSQGEYILRGGSWDNSISYCTVSFRHCKTAGTVSSDVGFRVCR